MRFWEALLSSFLRRVVRQGTLVVHHADDRVEQVGEAGSASVTVRLRDHRVARAIVLNPSLGLGDAYVDGRLTVDDDNLYGLLELLIVNPGHRVLDIGCGWGGLALHLAKVFGAQVTGITLSEQR